MKNGKSGIVRALAAFWRDESGAIMLETVLVFPIQILLTLFIVQSAFLWSAANIVNYAAFQAARTAMLEIRGASIDAEAEKKAWIAAHVVTSVLSNPIKRASDRAGAQQLRTLHHDYYMPKGHFLGDSLGLQVYVGFDSNLGKAVDDQVIVAAVRYYFPLTVPLAGGLMGLGYPGNVLRGVRYIPMEQVARLPKPWPY